MITVIQDILEVIFFIIGFIIFTGMGWFLCCMIAMGSWGPDPNWWFINIGAGFFGVIYILVIIAYGHPSYLEKHKHNDSAVPIAKQLPCDNNRVTTVIQKLPDGREITCLQSNTNLSCDWGNSGQAKQ